MQKEIKISKEELKLLITECLHHKDEIDKKQKSNKLEVLKILLTPLMIALVGLLGTWIITNKELKNAQILAEKQNINAQLIANNQIEAAHIRAKSQQDVEMFNYILPIHNSIMNDLESSDPDFSVINAKLFSLQTYGHTSLSFLMNYRDLFSQKNAVLAKFVEEIIVNIIKFSQYDLTNYLFAGTQDDRLNMRNVNLQNYEMSGSIFRNVILYKAKFNQSSLRQVAFMGADLVGADFSYADLSGSTFHENTNLRNTDFSNANLRKVKFQNCRNLSKAKFSFVSLLNADSMPFREIPDHTYLSLLNRHKDKLKEIYKKEKNPEQLTEILEKIGMSHSQFKSYLEKS